MFVSDGISIVNDLLIQNKNLELLQDKVSIKALVDIQQCKMIF